MEQHVYYEHGDLLYAAADVKLIDPVIKGVFDRVREVGAFTYYEYEYDNKGSYGKLTSIIQ